MLLRDSRPRFLILGAGARAARLHEAWMQSAPLTWELSGFVGDGEKTRVRPVLGPSTDVLALLRKTQSTHLVVATEEAPAGDTAAQMLAALGSGTRLMSMLVFYELLTGRVPAAQVGEVWNAAASAKRCYARAKQALDLAAGALGSVILALLLPPVAAAIKAGDGGPVFDRQERVGQFGRRFFAITFRAHAREGSALPASSTVGAFLRRSRLVKIPLFLNLLRGEMSLVGPDPETPESFTRQSRGIPIYGVRTLAKPGLIGWAQMRVRHDVRCAADSLRRLEYDLYYVKNASLSLDFRIVWSALRSLIKA